MPGRSRGGSRGGAVRGTSGSSSRQSNGAKTGRGGSMGGRSSSGHRGGCAAGSPPASHGAMPRSQSLNTPPTRLETYSASHHNRRGGVRGTPAQLKHTAGGRASHHHGAQHASGLVNPYLWVELEHSNVWKISVPRGQAFGKQFLAGLEVWAEALIAAYQGGKGPLRQTVLASTPPPPPPPRAQSGASTAPAPPSRPDSYSLTSTTGGTAAAASAASSQGALDWVTFLSSGASSPAPVTPTPPQTTKRTITAPAGLPTDNFYRPQVQRDEPGPASRTGVQALAAEQQQMLLGGFLGGLEPTSTGATAETQSPASGLARQWWPAVDTVCSSHSDRQQRTSVMEAVTEGVEQGDNEVASEHAAVVEGKEEGHGDGGAGRGEESGEGSEGTHVEDEEGDDDDDISYDYDDMAFADVDYDLDALSEDMFAHEDQMAAASTPLARVASDVKAAAGPIGSTPVRASGRSASAPVRVRVSLRLERHALTDTELELFTRWYQERGVHLVELCKLWLFDNRLGDGGAACVASLMHPGLLEIHLSHNSITTQGAQFLLSSVPTDRGPAQGRPLWLRLEWNIINPTALLAFAEDQRRCRGLKLDVPKVVPSEERGHEMNLQLKGSPHQPRGSGAAVDAHACLPWLQCQKQPPNESAILQDVKNIYRTAQPSSGWAKTAPKAAAPVPAAPTRTPSQSPAPLPSPPPPPPAGTRRSSSDAVLPLTMETGYNADKTAPICVLAEALPSERNEAVLQQLMATGAQWADGPLLLFPDTSALVSMLSANIDLPCPAFSLEALKQLARSGRFGRSLGRSQQTFLVVADSVMMQLDGLKHLPTARAAIRGFLSDGLEECGPAGLDFLTVLGAHEGEGLALSAGALGTAGSRSPFLANKGQAVDYRIVEVALFFMNEVVKAAGGAQDTTTVPALPVMLLSNDNAQVATAKAHGLPAVKLTAERPDTAAILQAVASTPNREGGGLTSAMIRGLMGPAATTGLGSTAPTTTLQDSFDAVVAALHATTAALSTAQSVLEDISSTIQLSTEGKLKPNSALAAIQATLKSASESLVPAAGFTSSIGSIESQGSTYGAAATELGTGAAEQGLAASLQGLLAAVQGPLADWDARCRSHQQPSRVLKWALPSNWS